MLVMKEMVCSLEMLLEPGLLLDKQEAAMTRMESVVIFLVYRSPSELIVSLPYLLEAAARWALEFSRLLGDFNIPANTAPSTSDGGHGIFHGSTRLSLIISGPMHQVGETLYLDFGRRMDLDLVARTEVLQSGHYFPKFWLYTPPLPI